MGPFTGQLNRWFPGVGLPRLTLAEIWACDRVVLRLEVGLAGTEALDGLLLLLLGRRHLVPLAVGLSTELRDVIPLVGRDPLGVLRLRLLLAEVALGVVELDLEAARRCSSRSKRRVFSPRTASRRSPRGRRRSSRGG